MEEEGEWSHHRAVLVADVVRLVAVVDVDVVRLVADVVAVGLAHPVEVF